MTWQCNGTGDSGRWLLLGHAGSDPQDSWRDQDARRLFRRRVPNATYHNHGSHAEAIEINFDPTVTSYRTLLEFFFQIHDPTTRNRQGNDVGTSYRSAIFHVNDEQKRAAEDTIADVNASGLWPGKVVTEVSPPVPFGRLSPSIKTTCNISRTATPAISSGHTGNRHVEPRRRPVS